MKEKTILQAFPEGFAKPHALSEMAKDTAILVGFSGGADSRALLDLLMKYARLLFGKGYWQAEVS